MRVFAPLHPPKIPRLFLRPAVFWSIPLGLSRRPRTFLPVSPPRVAPSTSVAKITTTVVPPPLLSPTVRPAPSKMVPLWSPVLPSPLSRLFPQLMQWPCPSLVPRALPFLTTTSRPYLRWRLSPVLIPFPSNKTLDEEYHGNDKSFIMYLSMESPRSSTAAASFPALPAASSLRKVFRRPGLPPPSEYSFLSRISYSRRALRRRNMH